MSHAIIDSERKTRNRVVEGIRKTQDIAVGGNRNELRDAHLVGTLTDLNKQHGTAMTATQFMSKLRLLNPDLICKPHPSQSGFCNLYLSFPQGLMHLMPMEDWMPEWSVMGTTEARKPVHRPDGFWAPVETLGAEVKRGWRTVLIRLIEKGLIGLEATERLFGPGNRRNWAALTGKTKAAPLL